uniref:Uncharacterized protein n=1 Tax=Heliothis virescens TaxID=7102 RepID=A0A2A4JE98_HELVI
MASPDAGELWRTLPIFLVRRGVDSRYTGGTALEVRCPRSSEIGHYGAVRGVGAHEQSKNARPTKAPKVMVLSERKGATVDYVRRCHLRPSRRAIKSAGQVQNRRGEWTTLLAPPAPRAPLTPDTPAEADASRKPAELAELANGSASE